MSKEEEAYVQRTSDSQTHPTAPQPTVGPARQDASPETHPVYPRQSYNSVMPGTHVIHEPVGNPSLYPQTAFGLNNEKKSVIEAYLLWLVLGLLGAHHFYLRRPWFGVLYFFTFGLCGVGYLIDLFRLPYLVNQANKRRFDASENDEKNISDAYTLWFPFGFLGFHHFYLGNPGLGLLYFMTLGVFGIGWLVDLFRIPYMVRNANSRSPLEKREKSVCTGYVFAVSPFGILGAHHFYLNRPIWGMLYFFTFGLCGFGWIVDWFRVPILVKRANKEIAFGPDQEFHADDAYILWFPFGLIGAHQFYLRRPLWGIVYFFTFGLFGIGWLVDGCRMVCLVKESNKRSSERVRLPIYGVPRTGIIISGGTQPPHPHIVAPYSTGYEAPVYYPPQQLPPQAAPFPPPYQYGQQQTGAPAPSYMEQPPPYYSQAGYPPAQSNSTAPVVDQKTS